MRDSTSEWLLEADAVSVRYMIRYYRADVRLRDLAMRALRATSSDAETRRRWTEAHWAVRDVSLRVARGECVGIIGRNGSGKTTLMRTLAGVFDPDRGAVRRCGDVTCLLSLGAGFNGNLSGLENIYLNGTILGLAREAIDERVEEVAEFSDLGQFLQAPVRTYSAGMRTRLGFCIALLADPDLVILDEVIAAGDAAFRKKAGDILSRFRDGRKAVLIASHSMGVIKRNCDRVIWLDQGRVRMEGAVAEVLPAYAEDVEQHRSRLGAAGGAT